MCGTWWFTWFKSRLKAVEVESNLKKKVAGECAVKKNHAFKNQNWGFMLNQQRWNGVVSRLIQWQLLILDIVSVVFFFTASYFCSRSQNFRVFRLWPAVTPVQKLKNPISYTFSEPSGRQLSHGGTLDIWCSSKISLHLTKCKKLPVFAFFGVPLQKKFKWLPIGQFWSQKVCLRLILKLMSHSFQNSREKGHNL